MIYQIFVTKKHWSLAWYFREYGYATTAIHPYYDWFWKRNTVYPLLGFENIYFNEIETDEDGAIISSSLNYIDIKGRYISDQAVSWEIISRYKMFSEEGDKPVFTFAVTMQNHGPYSGQYGADTQIRMINDFDDRSRRIVETFAEGIRYASEAFVYLTEYFKNIERPTYIIMFGDHSPVPIVQMDEYFAFSYNEDTPFTRDVIYKRYTTPIVVWTNFDDPETDEKIKDIKTVTSPMLTNELFNITGMPKPAYIKMLENVKNTTRGFTFAYVLDENGDQRPANNFKTIEDIYKKLRVVQYDATLGKNYFIDEFIEFEK